MRPLPLASIPAAAIDPPIPKERAPGTDPSQAAWTTAAGKAEPESVSHEGAKADQAPEESPIRWRDLAGRTRPEQIKNILAAFGAVTIVFHGLRIYGALQGKKTPRRRRTTRRQYRIWY